MIEVEGLNFQYPGKDAASLENLHFSIQKGEVFGFLGPSGAGKSTMQKILIGILKSYYGSVKVLGEEARTTTSKYYERIGVAFEFPNFYHKLSGLENLSLFQQFYSVPTYSPMDMLRMVGLEEAANRKFKDYSKGMKMRLNFCRAVMHNPDLIFLDEPTSGLDPVNARMMKDIILQKRQEGKTIVLTTHNMQIAEELCDRIAFIVDGKIPIIDTPEHLKVKYGRKLLEVQYQSEKGLVKKEYNLNHIGRNQEFLNLVHNYPIVTMHTLEATLEEIFLKVTGRVLQ